MRASLRFYLDGLGFRLKVKWTPETPDQIRWCWLEIGSAALMLQEYAADAGHSARVPQPFGQARASASCARTRSRSIAMRSRKA
ncbi:MAG TPA: hypothetical protein VE907_05125 [Gammaproteobacteria bacterium]|nr:hypothetical protein [Gammaproteobacteria bacterium]